ncbi:MAG: hypothetical protein ABEJ92_10845 [Halobacteriales archaeon]
MARARYRVPLTEWAADEALGFAVRVVVLTLLVYALVRLPEAGAEALTGEAAPYWLAKLFLDVLVLSYVAVRSRWTGARLWATLWAVYVGIQAVSQVEIALYGMADWTAATTGIGRMALVGAAIVLTVTVGFGRFRGSATPARDGRLRLPTIEWAWKLALLAVTFLVLMIIAGLVVFEGLASVVDPAARAGYEIVDPPAWVLPFQLVRGLAFTALLVPVIAAFRGGYRETQLSVALLFAVLLSSNMLAGYAAVPGLLWVAHFFELFAQALVYGLLAVALLFRHHHPLRRFRTRRGSASGG